MTEQPPSASEQAREIWLEWMRSRPGGTYQSSIQATEFKRLTDIIAAALSVVATERDAAAIRAFGKRVWSDGEEVAYQAGVSDTRKRLRELDVLEAVATALYETTVGDEMLAIDWIEATAEIKDRRRAEARAALTKIAEVLK